MVLIGFRCRDEQVPIFEGADILNEIVLRISVGDRRQIEDERRAFVERVL